MTHGLTPRQGLTERAGPTAAEAPSSLRTMLYEVIAALQTVTEPDEDDLVVATVLHRLRSRRITFAREGTVAA